jgi:hypothetical protein
LATPNYGYEKRQKELAKKKKKEEKLKHKADRKVFDDPSVGEQIGTESRQTVAPAPDGLTD